MYLEQDPRSEQNKYNEPSFWLEQKMCILEQEQLW